MFETVVDRLSERILRYLNRPTGRYAPFFAPDIEVVRQSLKPCDVLLVEGNTRISAVIKYLTQSTWSHTCLYIGDALGPDPSGGEA
ncbi:MAG: lipo-like protein, partial [Alphaproteobacteria bacterium]|nr:lipo-like protein [Alphaproteobacteria bacterium]